MTILHLNVTITAVVIFYLGETKNEEYHFILKKRNCFDNFRNPPIIIGNRKLLLQIDYSLLLTFIFFFIFIGNMGRFPAFRTFLMAVLAGRVTPVAILSSQIISNVPAALLLSGFTNDWNSLIIVTNLGGLGTLIASMASLISYKQLAQNHSDVKGKYMAVFTVANIVFLIILYGAFILLA